MMIVVSKLLRLVFFLLIFLLIFSRVNQVYAVQSITENFDATPSSPVWTSVKNDGMIEIVDNALMLSAPNGRTFPYVYLNDAANYLNGDFVFETRLKINGPLNFGFGANLSDSLPLNSRTTDLQWSEIIFLFWPDQNGKYYLHSTPCPDTNTTCTNDNFNNSIATLFWNVWHDFKITREGSVFYVFLDGNQIFRSKPSLKVVSQLWLGNPQKTGGVTWGSLFVDYVRINSSATPTVTPTPEPTPEPVRPIIILPGLGASWDFGAILNGTAGTNWQIPSFVTLYKNLIESLKNAGYVEGDNLFIFGYDWRKGLDDLANDLGGYIDGLVAAGKMEATDKLDLVGHSYGGLVARAYGQKTGAEKIDKIITAGSPHQGVIDAFGLWEGATVWKNVWWQRAALELMTKLNQLPGENKVDTVRRLAPGIKDTLPTFDFLKKNDVLLSSNSLLQKNLTLTNLNGDIATIGGLLWANGGNNNQTDRFLRVGERIWLDRVLGMWEDGKPVTSPFETTSDGDGVVLSLSSTNAFINQALLAANHEQIVGGKESILPYLEPRP